MKNLIIAASLFFAIGATAQTKKSVPSQTAAANVVSPVKLNAEEAGKKDAANVAAFVTVSPESLVKLEQLFKTKHKMLDGDLSTERKQIISKSIEKKLESIIYGADMEKLKANTKLYQSLIN